MSVKRYLVLIVDNDQAVRDALQFSLQLEGLVVRTHPSASALLADPGLPGAGCVILDHYLPQTDGLDVLRRIRARRIDTPSILLTGHATAALRCMAEAAGVRLVLEKPFLDNALVANVLSILRRGASPHPAS